LSWHIAALTLDNLGDLPKRCRSCVYWELAPQLGDQAVRFGSPELEKEAWVSEVLLEWGSCGRVVYMLPSGPVSADAVLLTTMQVMPEFSGEGIGRMLAQAVAKDLTRRGVKAVEVFGDARPGTEPSCMVPADFLRSVGFKTVRPHPRWPRLRMELRSAMTWKEDVEAALEQLLNSITVPLPSAAADDVVPRSPLPAPARTCG
jgi:GNAT superfamily N-acetyltransferase